MILVKCSSSRYVITGLSNWNRTNIYMCVYMYVHIFKVSWMCSVCNVDIVLLTNCSSLYDIISSSECFSISVCQRSGVVPSPCSLVAEEVNHTCLNQPGTHLIEWFCFDQISRWPHAWFGCQPSTVPASSVAKAWRLIWYEFSLAPSVRQMILSQLRSWRIPHQKKLSRLQYRSWDWEGPNSLSWLRLSAQVDRSAKSEDLKPKKIPSKSRYSGPEWVPMWQRCTERSTSSFWGKRKQIPNMGVGWSMQNPTLWIVSLRLFCSKSPRTRSIQISVTFRISMRKPFWIISSTGSPVAQSTHMLDLYSYLWIRSNFIQYITPSMSKCTRIADLVSCHHTYLPSQTLPIIPCCMKRPTSVLSYPGNLGQEKRKVQICCCIIFLR